MMKLGLMVVVGLIFLSLCGWWVFSAIIVGPEWKRKDGGDLPGPPSGLEREKELITTQLNQALQVMGEPSISYIAAWNRLKSVAMNGAAKNESWRARRDLGAEHSGQISSVTGDPDAMDPGDKPDITESVSSTLDALNQSEISFAAAWQRYKSQEKLIILQAEKAMGSAMHKQNKSPRFIDNYDVDPVTKSQIQQAEELRTNRYNNLRALGSDMGDGGFQLWWHEPQAEAERTERRRNDRSTPSSKPDELFRIPPSPSY